MRSVLPGKHGCDSEAETLTWASSVTLSVDLRNSVFRGFQVGLIEEAGNLLHTPYARVFDQGLCWSVVLVTTRENGGLFVPIRMWVPGDINWSMTRSSGPS